MSPTSPESDADRRRAQGGAAHARQEYNARRAADPGLAFASEVYHSQRWRILRSIHLNREPLCRACYARGVLTAAVLVDHVVNIRLAPERAYDETNLQSLCSACHNVKTAREDRPALAVKQNPPDVAQDAPLPPVPSDVSARWRAKGSRWARRG